MGQDSLLGSRKSRDISALEQGAEQTDWWIALLGDRVIVFWNDFLASGDCQKGGACSGFGDPAKSGFKRNRKDLRKLTIAQLVDLDLHPQVEISQRGTVTSPAN